MRRFVMVPVFCASFVAVVVGTNAACPQSSTPTIDGAGGDEGEGDEGEGDADAGDALPGDRYCEELVDVFCPFYLRCGRMNVEDLAACRAAFPSSCEAKFEPRFAPLVAAGLLTLSAEGLEACVAHLEDVPCNEQFFELSGPCAAIWRGNVEAGGTCGLDVETFVCAPGTTCTLDLSFCGVCATVLPVGAPCRDANGEPLPGDCGPTAECADDDVCVARPTSGQRCDPDGVPCALPARCADDGVCREPEVVAVGAACDSARRCPYFATCSAGRCAPLVGVGAACVDDGDCEASWCADGVCVELLPGDAVCVRSAQCGSAACVDGACKDFAPLCVGG
jgi:hypothetical protein